MTAAYSTTDPEIIAAYRAADGELRDFSARVCEAARQLGKNKGVLRQGGRMLGHSVVAGLVPDDPADPPEGWRYVKSRRRLEPRRGPAGEPAEAWLIQHQAPKIDIRGMLDAQYGLPRYSSSPGSDPDSRRVGCPGILFHDGTLWAAYDGHPCGDLFGFRDLREPDERWTLRRPSEFYAAREAYEAAHAETAGTPA